MEPETAASDHHLTFSYYSFVRFTNWDIVLNRKHHLTVTEGGLDFAGFAASRDISFTPHGDPTQSIVEKRFSPPLRRYGEEDGGTFATNVVFGAYDLKYQGTEYLVVSLSIFPVSTLHESQMPNVFTFLQSPVRSEIHTDLLIV